MKPNRDAEVEADMTTHDEARIRADERNRVEGEIEAMDARRPAGDRDELESDVGSGRDPVWSDDQAGDRYVGESPYVSEPDHGRVTGPQGVVNDDRSDEIEVVRKRAFSFGQLLTVLVGAALVTLGIFALVETGVETPLDQPVEPVMGYDHTPLLAISEIVAGGLLLLFSLRPGGRWFVALVGLALMLVGVMIFAELDWTVNELGAEQAYAWIPIVAGLVALLSALLTPRRYQRMTGTPTSR